MRDADIRRDATGGSAAALGGPKIGDTFTRQRRVTQRDCELLAAAAGTTHCAPVWPPVLLSGALDQALPGLGAVPVMLSLRQRGAIAADQTVTVHLTVRHRPAPNLTGFSCEIQDQEGGLLVDGTLLVQTGGPDAAAVGELPDIRVNDHVRHRELIARCKGIAPALTAVVHPCDAASLDGVVAAAAQGLITPILVGPEAKIRGAAAAAGLDISAFRLVPAPHSHAAAAEGVALARRGEAEAVMKGSLHTDELMHEVMRDDTGLRTGRRISHVYLFDVAGYPRPLLITDAAVNIQPTLADKRDICQNAIDLARTLGIAVPKVAILSAVETVSDKIPSTLEAAALCKMADRGQIEGGQLDGPLAFDNAVSPEAAKIKGLSSPVAGQADILLVPDLESGNMLAKQLTFFAGADGAGIVLGARLPIILTSRADPLRTRIASAAIALLMVEARRREGRPA